MPDYRIYEIGQHGHVVRVLIELTLPSDVIAIAYAERLPTLEAIEIWEGERLVDRVRFTPSTPNVAA
jgi:hypothetical protein